MPDVPFSRIAVMGAGAWGTALAAVATLAGRDSVLWGRDGAALAAIAARRENSRYLPGIRLPEFSVIADARQAAAGADAILLAVPAQTVRDFVRGLAPHIAPHVPLVLCAKGIEKGSGKLISEVLAEAAPRHPRAILSGPSFARDVALGLPTAVTIAGDLAQPLQESLGAPAFRPYASDDITGVALGGAAKNVYAIASGVVEGMKLGENARAALLARSFAELARLGEAMGARRETLMGLSGLGDLVLSATSRSSRNFSHGAALGSGTRPDGKLAEGVDTAPALVLRARTLGVEMPIAEAMADLLSGALPLEQAMMRLMSRKLTVE